MGRKKKEAAVIETAPTDNPQMDQVRERHAELQARIEEIHADASYYQSRISGELKNKLIDKLEGRIDELIAELEYIPKSDLEKAQGYIAGIREAKQFLLGQAYDSELKRLEEELSKFEEENALFLTAPMPDGKALIVETMILDMEDPAAADLSETLTAAGFCLCAMGATG